MHSKVKRRSLAAISMSDQTRSSAVSVELLRSLCMPPPQVGPLSAHSIVRNGGYKLFNISDNAVDWYVYQVVLTLLRRQTDRG